MSVLWHSVVSWFNVSVVAYDFYCPGSGAKQKKLAKGQLNILGLIITVLFTNISTTAQVSNICLILLLYICHCLRHHYLFKTVTNLINEQHDNTEITDWYKNWNIILFKEALNIKKLTKELQLFWNTYTYT